MAERRRRYYVEIHANEARIHLQAGHWPLSKTVRILIGESCRRSYTLAEDVLNAIAPRLDSR